MRHSVVILLVIVGLTGCGGGVSEPEAPEPVVVTPHLEVVAESDRQWTGVALTADERLFVNFPRWWPEVLVSVAEVAPDGSSPQVHADGIAYDRANDIVYYQALTGRTLYRIAGAVLRDPSLDGPALASKVETVAASGPSDGLLWDGVDGVFISAIEDNAVKRWSPVNGVETVIADPRIAWPDSFAFGSGGDLYVTTSQIHRGPNPPEPYRVLRIQGF